MGAAAAVAEVDLAEGFPSEVTQLPLAGADIVGVEEETPAGWRGHSVL
ncbi:hypothetical protein [Streptomyces sp. NWU339]|nr:hypothetical protein [Streptomyces sp. NWU339]